MIVLTGTDGFIGKNLLQFFHERTDEQIIDVDFKSTIKPYEFLEKLKQKKYTNISTIIHNGACSDTTNSDLNYMLKNNFEFTKKLFNLSTKQGIRFIYASSASVYGDGPFVEDTDLKPKNIYALSKSMFDQYYLFSNQQAVGLRYFNVYGKYEENKHHMASVAYKFFNQIDKGEITIFENSENYLRDFIHIDDVCEITYKIFSDKSINGIYNVGTGKARSFKDIADIFSKKYSVNIKTIPMPEILEDKYQKFTKSNNDKISKVIDHKYLTLEQGIEKYLKYLESK